MSISMNGEEHLSTAWELGFERVPTEYHCSETTCTETFRHGVQGSFCSTECYYRHKGEKAVNLLRHDHRLCTCGRWLKKIERTPDGWEEDKLSRDQMAIENGGKYHTVDGRIALDVTECYREHVTAADSVIGFQYRTENAITVEKEFETDTATNIIKTGTGCECGLTNTSEVDEDLREIELAEVLARYVRVFWALWDEGQLDQKLDKDVFFSEFKETRDVEYALGKGLYASL